MRTRAKKKLHYTKLI